MSFRSKLIQLISGTILALAMQAAFAHSAPISFSAQHVKQMPGKHESLLTGDVKISVGKIHITGDKALVKYSQKKITQFVIYGEGTFTSGHQLMQFKNAIFTPATGRITADTMKRID